MSAQSFRPFQIRWNEALGKPECPYLHRWVVTAFGYSVRLHHWIRSDDKQHFHDHAWNFLTVILKGSYTDVAPDSDASKQKKEVLTAGDFRFRKAEWRHYVDVPVDGAWSLLFCGKPKRKWGFWVRGNLWRPLRYFSKFGLPPCDLQ